MDVSTLILVFAIAALVAYVIWLRGQISTQAQEQFRAWREREIQSIRVEQAGLANREASTHLERWKNDNEQLIRQEAIKRSQNVITGKVTEQMIPFLPNFRYNPRDARFLGSPVDFIVFDGLDQGEVRQVVFVEVKTGSSSLNKREKQVRDVVDARKVKWEELRLVHEQIAPAKARTTQPSPDSFRSDLSMRPYDMTESYHVGETISHQTFGAGRVIAVQHNKIEVQFAKSIKNLAHKPI